MKTATFTLPAHWACYLINGDPSEFSLYDDGDEELAYIDQWLAMNGLGHCLDCSERPFFARTCDADTLAGDMLEHVFEVLEPATCERDKGGYLLHGAQRVCRGNKSAHDSAP